MCPDGGGSRSRSAWPRVAVAALGFACLIFYGLSMLQPAIYEHNAAVYEPKATPEQPKAAPEAVQSARAVRPPAKGEMIGRVEIPRLKLSAAVAEGDDDFTLGRAVGHVPDTIACVGNGMVPGVIQE